VDSAEIPWLMLSTALAYEAILALRRFAIPSPAGSSLALFMMGSPQGLCSDR
jgi:hypothetical protein